MPLEPRAMDTAHQEFLNRKLAPARLNAMQAAWFLGFEPHEITILIATGCLKPLGHPARNATKFFATETLQRLRRDEKWLSRASDAIWGHWREQNARKHGACGRANGQGRSVKRSAGRAEATTVEREPAPPGTE